MEENPNNMVEDAPACAKRRSNILPLVIAVLVCAALAGAIVLMRGGCSNSATHKLKMAVTEANSGCPYDMGAGGSLLSIKYDEDRNEVAMLMATNEEFISLDMLKQNNAIAKKQMRLSFSRSANKQVLQDLVNAGASFKVTFKGMSSGKTVDILFPTEEVKEMLNSNMSQAEIDEMRFENWLLLQNSDCPRDFGNGAKVIKFEREADNVICYIQVEYADVLDNLRVVKDEAKCELLSEIAGDRTGQSELQLMTSNGVGVVYRFYHDDPKKCVDYAFTVDELHNALQKAMR